MPKTLYGNFEFEHELESTAYRVSARVAAQSAQLAPHLIALAADGDFVWSPLSIPQSFLDAAAEIGLPNVKCAGSFDEDLLPSQPPLELVPWGFSQAAFGVAAKRNWIVDGPDVAVVRQVNDRRFAFAAQAFRSGGLPGSSLVSSHEDFLKSIREAAAEYQTPEAELQWVIKSPFGMASRARIRGTGSELDDASAGWLRKQFDKNGSALFEPWLECDREFSTQWVIPKEGDPALRGWTEIQTERAGTPSGWLRYANVSLVESEFQTAFPVLTGSVELMAAQGYFGPVGIDSMRYRVSDSETNLRPLQDINARYTMGRVALELADRLAPDVDAAWLMVPSKELCRILDVRSEQDARVLYSERGLDISVSLHGAGWNAGSQSAFPDDAQAWLTSPLWLGDVLAQRCGVLVASRDRTRLTEFFRSFELLPGGNISPQTSGRT